MTTEQVEIEALRLTRRERARLAQRLIASLDGDDELEQAWYDEAERRLAALEAGKSAEIPSDEVFATPGLKPER